MIVEFDLFLGSEGKIAQYVLFYVTRDWSVMKECQEDNGYDDNCEPESSHPGEAGNWN